MSVSETRVFDIDPSGDQRALQEAIPARRTVEGIGRVASTLMDVAEAARDARIPNVHFTPVYGRLSERIYERLDEFDQPDDLNKTSGIFLDAFLDPLRSYAEGRYDDVPEHWRLALFDPRVRNILPVLQFRAGMDTHIQYDLIPVLAESGIDERYHHDFTHKVGKEIRDTSYEQAPTLLPGPKPLARLLGAFALPPIIKDIADDRENSWNAAMELMAAREAGDEKRCQAILQRAEAAVIRRNRQTLALGHTATLAIRPMKRLLALGD